MVHFYFSILQYRVQYLLYDRYYSTINKAGQLLEKKKICRREAFAEGKHFKREAFQKESISKGKHVRRKAFQNGSVSEGTHFRRNAF